jgi:hypothetical protein
MIGYPDSNRGVFIQFFSRADSIRYLFLNPPAGRADLFFNSFVILCVDLRVLDPTSAQIQLHTIPN